MNQSRPSSYVEVEIKFQGGQQECNQIVAWFAEHGFEVERKEPVHRVHVYFDDQERLRTAGCRFRSVIAPGEWCRYDFKADDRTGRGETTEVSLKKPLPVPLPEAIATLASSLPETAAKAALLGVKDSVRVILVMTGTHQKFIAIKDGLNLEISWDCLVPLETGVPLTEVEIELLTGERSDFDGCIEELQTALGLARSCGSKLDTALSGKKPA